MKLQESIIQQNPNLDWNQVVTWQQWKNLSLGENENSLDNKQEKPKRILDKVRYRGTIAELLSRFINSVNHMSIHLFHFHCKPFSLMNVKNSFRMVTYCL